MILTVNQVTVTSGTDTLLGPVSFTLSSNQQRCAIIGQSGAGKTTLLRCLAGVQPYRGSIHFQQQALEPVPVHQRQFSLVDQHGSLFPHLTVFENIAYPLRLRHLTRPEIDERVATTLAQIQLVHLADRLPQQLSGGQQQRVALARALIYQPRLLLLDEPLRSLDAITRYDMTQWLQHITATVAVPMVFVTHDVQEARALCNYVIILHQGQLVAQGTWLQLADTAIPLVQQLLSQTL
ncbi:MAG: ATP-binding cassette domain-containing protein [Candidatus Kerfeldbacteria bacterium]|nr:ATP-binding cassette domain-containing protein [Candidatus Kerfeldbacteria bacterium]